MFKIKVVCFFVMLLLRCSSTYAQQPYMWHITDEDGLPSMEVYNMLQDKKGFIWMGTDNGVCKYDGNHFTTFYNPNQRGKSFSFFHEDNTGKIWCVNFAGQIYYVENDSLKLFEPFEKVYKTGFPRYCFDNKDQLWIISEKNPIYYYNFKTNKLTPFDSTITKNVMNIYANKNGEILFSSNKIGFIKNNRVTNVSPFASNIHYSVYEDEFYIINESEKLKKISSFEYGVKNEYLNNEALEKANANARFIDFLSFNSNDRWYLTYDGLWHYTANSTSSKLHSHILKGNAISWMIKDKEGNYWFSTLKNGVFVMPSENVWIMDKENSPLSTSRVSKMQEDKNGNIYLGTGLGNISIFNPLSKKIIGKISIGKEEKDFDAITIDKVNNKLYSQASNSQIYDLNTNKTLFRFVNFSSIKKYAVDIYGNFLIASTGMAAFVIINEKGKKSPFFKQFKFVESKDSTSVGKPTFWFCNLRNQRCVSSFIGESDSTLWISFVDGLYYYKNGKQYIVKDQQNNHIYATGFSKGVDGTMWMSTVQNGVIAIKNRKIILHLTEKSGLKSNFIRCINAYTNTVWFATDKGVQGYNISTKKIMSFSKEDGLITNDVLSILVNNNNVYLATAKGFQWFNEYKLKTNIHSPYISVQKIFVNDFQLSLSKEYQFKSNQNNITFHYTGIALKSRGNMQFAYRLLGLDSTWTIVASTERMVRFNALAPGNYRFELKAINEDGVQSNSIETVNFEIAQPYWQKWWFVLFVILLIGSIVSLFFAFRIKIIHRENNLEQEKAQLEIDLRSSQLSALKVQMNPHFIFNALNSIQDYILTNEKRLANTYLGKFSDLMRLYLEMSNKKNISLEEEIKALELYLELESLRFEDSFEYELKVSPELQTYDMMIPSMIIQPYIENAIKHGLFHKKTARILLISFFTNDEFTLTCEVIDNGIGRKKSHELNALRHKKHNSFATEATKKRLDLLNNEGNDQIGVVYEDLLNDDHGSRGTKVIITIPYSI